MSCEALDGGDWRRLRGSVRPAKTGYFYKGDYAVQSRMQPGNGTDRKNAAAYGTRYLAYERLGKLDQAVKDCGRLVALAPKDAESRVRLAEVHTQEREFEKAIREYGEAIRLDPGSVHAYYGRGRAILDTAGVAISDFTQAIRLAPKNAHRLPRGVVRISLARTTIVQLRMPSKRFG